MFFAGCANPYSKFYNDYSGGINVAENPDVIIPVGKPKLIQGSNVEADSLRMLENGYLLLGASNFNAGAINQNTAIDHARKVYADTVVVYSQYTNTASGSVPLTVPNTQTSYYSGSIYGSGGGMHVIQVLLRLMEPAQHICPIAFADMITTQPFGSRQNGSRWVFILIT